MSTWQAVWQTLATDFGDIPDAAQATRVVVRLLTAAILGGAIGYEREQRGKAAGMRTHMLVAIGAALFVLVMQQGGGSAADVSRVIQGVVAGIGFLGAGTILIDKRKKDIRGLTTAASIWLTAAIGVAAGLGRGSTAVLTAVLALVVLAVLPHAATRAFPPRDPGPATTPTPPAGPREGK